MPLGKAYHSSSALDPSLRSSAYPSLLPLRWVRAPHCRNLGNNLPLPPRQLPPRLSGCCCPRWNLCNSRKGAKTISCLRSSPRWMMGRREVATLSPWPGPSRPPFGGRQPPRWLPVRETRVSWPEVNHPPWVQSSSSWTANKLFSRCYCFSEYLLFSTKSTTRNLPRSPSTDKSKSASQTWAWAFSRNKQSSQGDNTSIYYG